jgi:opine dehydrogenase
VGVDAPIAHGLVAITGGYLGRDLRQGPRTLEALGLLHHSPAQLREMLHQGEGA